MKVQVIFLDSYRTLDTFDATQNGHSVVHIIVEKVNKFASLSADDYQVEL